MYHGSHNFLFRGSVLSLSATVSKTTWWWPIQSFREVLIQVFRRRHLILLTQAQISCLGWLSRGLYGLLNIGFGSNRRLNIWLNWNKYIVKFLRNHLLDLGADLSFVLAEGLVDPELDFAVEGPLLNIYLVVDEAVDLIEELLVTLGLQLFLDLLWDSFLDCGFKLAHLLVNELINLRFPFVILDLHVAHFGNWYIILFPVLLIHLHQNGILQVPTHAPLLIIKLSYHHLLNLIDLSSFLFLLLGFIYMLIRHKIRLIISTFLINNTLDLRS